MKSITCDFWVLVEGPSYRQARRDLRSSPVLLIGGGSRVTLTGNVFCVAADQRMRTSAREGKDIPILGRFRDLRFDVTDFSLNEEVG